MYRVVAFYTAISQGRRYVPYQQEKSTVEIRRGNAPPVKGDAQSMPEGKRVQSKKSPSITQPVVSSRNAVMRSAPLPNPMMTDSRNAVMRPSSNTMMSPSPLPNAVMRPSPLPNAVMRPSPLPNAVMSPSPLPNAVMRPSSNTMMRSSPLPNAMMRPSSNTMMRSSPNTAMKPSPLPRTIRKPSSNTAMRPSFSPNTLNAIPKPPPARMQPLPTREPPKNSLASLAMALQQFNKSFSLVCCNKERMGTITGYSVYSSSLRWPLQRQDWGWCPKGP